MPVGHPGSIPCLVADRTENAGLIQVPPRITLSVPVSGPLGSSAGLLE
jgi:hypothetical protein